MCFIAASHAIRTTALAGLVLVMGLGLSPLANAAQGADGEPCITSERLRAAIAALEQDRPDHTMTVLGPIVSAEPGCSTDTEGAVAYWLSVASGQAGHSAAVPGILATALRATEEAGLRDLRLTDAYITALLDKGDARSVALAAAEYLAFWQIATPPFQDWEQEVVERHLAQVRPLLAGTDVLPEFGRQRADRSPPYELRPADGYAIARWFASEDPFPASELNERVAEHLLRVTHALEQFASDYYRAGFDERGDVLIRLGWPTKREAVRFDDFSTITQIARYGVNVSFSDFPRNEIWSYSDIPGVADFIFVEDRILGYQIGTASDLLPLTLRSGFDHTNRGQSRAVSALTAMRLLYEKLALHHSGYSSLYQGVDAYFQRQESLRAMARNTAFEIGEGLGQDQVQFYNHGTGGSDWPTDFVRRTISEARAQDRLLMRNREENVPQQRSRLRDGLGSAFRDARFARMLESDGSTRALVFWQDFADASTNDLGEAATLRTRARVVSVSEDGLQRSSRLDTLLANPRTGQVYRMQIGVPDQDDNLVLQVDQYATVAVEDDAGSDLWLGTSVLEMRDLAPLNDARDALELSDLVPFAIDDVVFARTRLTERFSLDDFRLFPGRGIGSGEAVGVYFEVYNYTGSPADYLISYEVIRRRDGGVFRRERVEDSFFQSRRTGDTPRLPAAVLIDPAQIQGADHVEILVTVIDLVRDIELERTISFAVSE
jgi:hypothetical protein